MIVEEMHIEESEILQINTKMEEEAEKANIIWRNSVEWAKLQLQKLATAQIQRQAEKDSAPKNKLNHIGHHKKFKVEKLKQGEYLHGVDA